MLQQTPSVQKPLPHWAARAQGPPCSRALRQVPLSHHRPIGQSASTAHGGAQASPMHSAGAQLLIAPATQPPLPSHRLAARSVATSQLPTEHTEPAGWKRHAPAPSQAPSRPQVVGASSAHSSSGSCPAGTGRQRPTLSAWSHDSQTPGQAVWQQTPSTQCSDTHPPSSLQGNPSGDRGESMDGLGLPLPRGCSSGSGARVWLTGAPGIGRGGSRSVSTRFTTALGPQPESQTAAAISSNVPGNLLVFKGTPPQTTGTPGPDPQAALVFADREQFANW
jgi:hypothetical protein